MMLKYRHTPNIHQFLEQSGVLVNGSEEEIKKTKKVYRQQYLLKYKQWQRKNKPEFTVHFSKENNEYQRIKKAAAEHKMKIPGFLKSATLAYISKQFIVPDKLAIAGLEQLLSQCFSEIQSLAKNKQMLYWQQFDEIQKRIEKLEKEITETLRNPQTLEECIEKIADVSLKEKLLAAIISHNNIANDNQNQIAQETHLQTIA